MLTSDGHVRHVGFTPGHEASAQWQSLFGSMVSAPSLVSWGPGRLDVFALGSGDHRVHHKWAARQTDGQMQWAPFGQHGTRRSETRWTRRSSPSPARGPERLDIFARGGAGDVVHMFYDPTVPDTLGGWGPSRSGQVQWESLGGQILGSPVAVSWGPQRIDLFAVGTNNYIYTKHWDGHHWQPTHGGGWAGPLGDRPVKPGSLCVVSDQPGQIDLFALAAERCRTESTKSSTRTARPLALTPPMGPERHHRVAILGRPPTDFW